MRIPAIASISQSSDIQEVSELFDTLPQHHISHQPWIEFKSNCHTSFVIAHSGDAIFLKFYVKEDIIKLATHQTNGRVHKDNCVEFFVAFESQKKYYNIEINCAGVALIGYGEGRLNRKLLDEKLINKINTHINIQTAPLNSGNKYRWQVTVMLPIEVFEESNIGSLNQKSGSGNFFKCGDDLPNKHFYAWSNIEAKKPDFHLPQFFGKLEFS